MLGSWYSTELGRFFVLKIYKMCGDTEIDTDFLTVRFYIYFIQRALPHHMEDFKQIKASSGIRRLCAWNSHILSQSATV